LLAHLAQGSVRVGLGQTVIAGQRLARVGNTGNTTEPHLHIHAVRGRVTSPGQLAATGDPVPMLFDGQSAPLRRHDTVISSRLHRSATVHATAHPDRP
jgi:murein DD-endopeptidase MepM/ murein hydrolase activator NlpD